MLRATAPATWLLSACPFLLSHFEVGRQLGVGGHRSCSFRRWRRRRRRLDLHCGGTPETGRVDKLRLITCLSTCIRHTEMCPNRQANRGETGTGRDRTAARSTGGLFCLRCTVRTSKAAAVPNTHACSKRACFYRRKIGDTRVRATCTCATRETKRTCRGSLQTL